MKSYEHLLKTKTKKEFKFNFFDGYYSMLIGSITFLVYLFFISYGYLYREMNNVT